MTHTPIQLATAIRVHWQIEACHWVRDVTFGEDKIRCFNSQRSKNLTSLISVVYNLTKQSKVNNIKALNENLNANLTLMIP